MRWLCHDLIPCCATACLWVLRSVTEQYVKFLNPAGDLNDIRNDIWTTSERHPKSSQVIIDPFDPFWFSFLIWILRRTKKGKNTCSNLQNNHSLFYFSVSQKHPRFRLAILIYNLEMWRSYCNMKTAAWNYDDLWLGSAFSNGVFNTTHFTQSCVFGLPSCIMLHQFALFLWVNLRYDLHRK